MSGLDIQSFGCRLNAYEGEAMRRYADAAGLSDAVVVNTCAVTEEAVRQAQQAIRRARRERPQARIVATGCAAQIDPQRFAAMPEVDHVIGNGEKAQAGAWRRLAAHGQNGGGARIEVGDIMRVGVTASHMIEAVGARARALVEVQNGCDHRCTFCVIPYGRGPSRSVPAGEVVEQIRRLVGTGHAEVVLTGVDITAYGGDLGAGITLGRLVRRILKELPDLKRLRLSSIDQVEADNDLLAAFAEEERLMPHLHLSLQSGDDLILKRMKRRHLRADAVRFCERARRLRPGIVFGADLIAGFPTESEPMFESSVRLIDDCGLAFLHVFPYSSRPGTPAARMPQLPPGLVKDRARRLRRAGDGARARYLEGEVGTVTTVLMESERHGRSPQFAELRLTAPRAAASMVAVKIDACEDHRLVGTPLS